MASTTNIQPISPGPYSMGPIEAHPHVATSVPKVPTIVTSPFTMESQGHDRTLSSLSALKLSLPPNTVPPPDKDKVPLKIPSETPISHSAPVAQRFKANDKYHRSSVSSAQRRMVCKNLQSKDWVRFNEPEPPIDGTEGFLHELARQKQISSRFDILYKPNLSHGCLWDIDGKRCFHKTSRKDLAQDHARKHLHYAPFKCDGSCKKPGWCVNLDYAIHYL